MPLTTPPSDDLPSLQSLAGSHPVLAPQASLIWTACVTIDVTESLGPSSHGERFIVPITGGRFWGGPGHEALTGSVRPGGADRQLVRPDGVKELHALYEMQVDDGAVLTIDNRVLIDESLKPARYAMSRITVAAPQGPHAWLNRRLIIGTLQPMRPQKQAVLIRAFLVTA